MGKMKWFLMATLFPFLFLFLLISMAFVGNEKSKSNNQMGSVICTYISDELSNKELESKRSYVNARIVDENMSNAVLGIYEVTKHDLDTIIVKVNEYIQYIDEKGMHLNEIDYIQAYIYGKEYLDYVLENGVRTSLKSNKEYEILKGIVITDENKEDSKFYLKVLSIINPHCATSIDGLPINKPYVITGWFPNYNQDGTGDKHYGIDFGMPEGTDIFSIADAEVVSIGNACAWNGGYLGNTCGIEQGYSGAGNFVYYKFEQDNAIYYVMNCHMKAVNVNVGDHIMKGQKIGTVGNSGNSTGAHLHFEIHKDSMAIASDEGIINPCDFIEGLCTDYMK